MAVQPSMMGSRVQVSCADCCFGLGWRLALTSPAGKMTIGVIAAVAEFGRHFLIERTPAGLSRAKSEGKVLGRPQSLTKLQAEVVRGRVADGESVASLAREFGSSRQTIMRVQDSMLQPG